LAEPERPSGGKRLKFAEVVERLKRIATTPEEETARRLRVAVFVLDLTDPPLVGARPV
jgi:hypothetical protein